MSKLNIAVIYGGANSEHDVSKASAATVVGALSPNKYNIIPVYITKDGRWLLNDGGPGELLSPNIECFASPAILSPERGKRSLMRIVGSKVRSIPIDIVFPVLHGRMGEDGTIQGLCELSGIPCVGSGTAASAAAMDKDFTKALAHRLGIPQTPYLTYRAYELSEKEVVCKRVRQELGYPCFVKPANSGSSVGISKVRNKTKLLCAIEEALKHDTKIIIERAVKGRELECSILGNGDINTIVSVVGEVIPDGEFYTYDAKYNNKASKTIIPALIPQAVTEQVRRLALQIFRGIDARGMARADFFYSEDENTYFNEINTIPGWTNISMYPMLLNSTGLTTPEITDKLIDLALTNLQT